MNGFAKAAVELKHQLFFAMLTNEIHALIPIVERLLAFIDGLQSLLHEEVLSNLVGPFLPSTCATPEEEVWYKIFIDTYSEKYRAMAHASVSSRPNIPR